MRPGLTGLVFALLFAVLAGGAQAHTRSQSLSSWSIEKRIVRVSVTVPDLEADRITNGERPSDAAFLAYLDGHIGVTSRARDCSRGGEPRVVMAATGYRRAEFAFDCPAEDGITLHFGAFFDLVPTHLGLAQIQLANGDMVEQLFTSDVQTMNLTASEGGEFRDAGFFRFVEMGVMHIFTGIDHMSFLLGLVLISRRLRDLVFVVSGFTIGHSVTLALAVTGVIRPHAEYIDALVALTIVLIGVENIIVRMRSPTSLATATGGLLLVMGLLRFAGTGLLPPALLFGAALFSGCYLLMSGKLHGAGRIRVAVTAVFGLIHGFGFAADILDARLPTSKLLEILFGFNLGVEAGQLTVVFVITGIAMAARRLSIAPSRPITTDVLASVLVCIGVAWFISRSFA